MRVRVAWPALLVLLVLLCGPSAGRAERCPAPGESLWTWLAESPDAGRAITRCWPSADGKAAVPALVAEATLHLQRGAAGRAFETAQAAVERASGSAHASLRASALQIRGDALFFLGRATAAARDFEQALDLAADRRPPGRRQVATLHKDLGTALREIGDYETSLEHLDRAKALASERYFFDILGSVLGNLGSVYRRLGADHLAAATYLEQRRLAEATADDALALDALARLGELYLDAGSAARAQSVLEEALALLPGSTDQESTWLLEILADAKMAAGDATGSCEIFAATTERHRQGAPPFRLVASLIGRASCLEVLQPSSAEAAYREALEISKQSGRESWSAWAGLARLRRREGQLEAALAAFEKSLALALGEVDGSSAPSDRRRFRKRLRPLYDGCIEALWHRSQPGDLERAFELSERAKLGERAERWWHSRQGGSGLDERMVVLELEMARLSSQLLDGDGDPAAGGGAAAAGDSADDERLRRLDRLEVELRAREDRLWNPRLALAPPSLAELESAMPERSRLLSFHLTPGAVYIFDLAENRRGFFRVEVAALELELAVGNLLELVQRDGDLWRAAARRLTRRLIEPWWLPGPEDRLIVAAEDTLAAWPLALSPAPSGDGERAWMHDVAFESVLSATTAFKQWTASRPANAKSGRLLLVSQPMSDQGTSRARQRSLSLYDQNSPLLPLPDSRREIEAARRFSIAQPTVLVGSQATEERVRGALTQEFELVHFAAHAIWNTRHPARSALVLAPSSGQDGLFQAREILRLPTTAELVILSACQTARGGGDASIQHLADAFFIAGARSVVGSLWPVDDRKTAEFMSAFYSRLARGEPKAEALRRTQITFSQRWPPRHYAAFILIGDGSGQVTLKTPGRPVGKALLLGLGVLLAAWFGFFRRR